jgi:hypothetical protein
MPISGFGISLTSTITNLESLSTPLSAPKAPFKPYVRSKMASSGMTIGQGLPVVQWTFVNLTPAQREQLRTFCPYSSAVVYITTMTNEKDTPHSIAADSYQTFRAVMHWPDDERRDASLTHVRNEITFTFTHLVPV